MSELDILHMYIPIFGVFRNRLYDEGFTVLMASVISFVMFGYLRGLYNVFQNWMPKTPEPRNKRCHFCEDSNEDAIVDEVTDLCNSCGQLNAFEEDGDYSRPLPELYHAQMNSCMTPNSKRMGRNIKTPGSPQPATAPGNLLCSRCMDNQEKIVALKASFIPVGRGDAAFDREFEQFKRQLDEQYPLCQSCQGRVKQFVVEQDRQIAANVACSGAAGTQHKLFMAKPESGSDDVFVVPQRVYRRNQIVNVLTVISVVFPLLCGPVDLDSFWTLRIFTNFLAAGLAAVSALTSPHRRMPWTAFAVLCLFGAVALDLMAVFCYLKVFTLEDVAKYHLAAISYFERTLIQFCPMVVSLFAFLNILSLLPGDKRKSRSGQAFSRQNSTTTMTNSPTTSEPYVQSLLAETVINKRRKTGNSTPWRAFQSSRTQYSPMTNGSMSPSGVAVRGGRPPFSKNVSLHLLIAATFMGALVVYAHYAM